MSALGESVSFGRFLAEPLEWGKWSAFAHNRYLEEAAHQSRPGSVAQKKAFFEAHYARKRKTDADADATGSDVDPDEANAAAAAAVSSARSSSSSCMTDEPAEEETTSCVVGSGVVAAGPVEEMVELDVITDGGVGSYCGVDADEAAHHKQDGVLVGESRDVLQVQEKQEAATHDPCADNSVPADADDKQPLKVTFLFIKLCGDFVRNVQRNQMFVHFTYHPVLYCCVLFRRVPLLIREVPSL